jgi:tetratricopeptide (TPR) repeat protein
MGRVQLQFWNALTYLSTFLYLFFGTLAALDYSNGTPDRLKIFLNSLFHRSRLVGSEHHAAWIPLAGAALLFAIIARTSQQRKRLWRPSDYQALPAPNGGYLRKAGFPQCKQELRQATPRARREARHFFKLAERYFDRNLFQAAATAYQSSAFAFFTTTAYLNLGVSLCYSSSFQKSLEAFNTALARAKKSKNERLFSAALGNIGILHREQGNLTEALRCFKQTYGICEKIRDSCGEACGHGNLGSLFLAQGRPDEALKPWLNALEIFEKSDYLTAVATALDNVGSVYSAKGEHKIALEYHLRSQKIYKIVWNVPGQAQSLANIGYAYVKLGKARKSLKINRKALKLAGWLNSSLDRAKAHSNIGLVHQKKGRLEEALQSIQKAFELYDQISNPIGSGNQLLAMGVIYASRHERAEALRKLGEARSKFLQSGVMSDAVEAAIEMALRSKPHSDPVLKRSKTLRSLFSVRKGNRP